MAGGKAAASILSSTEFPLSCSVWLRQPTGSWIPAFFTVSAEVQLGTETGFVRGYSVYHTGHPLMPFGNGCCFSRTLTFRGFPRQTPVWTTWTCQDWSWIPEVSLSTFLSWGAKQCDVGHHSQLQASAVPAFIQQGRVTLNMSPWWSIAFTFPLMSQSPQGFCEEPNPPNFQR